jgi:hypothetical protein
MPGGFSGLGGSVWVSCIIFELVAEQRQRQRKFIAPSSFKYVIHSSVCIKHGNMLLFWNPRGDESTGRIETERWWVDLKHGVMGRAPWC